MSNVLYSMLLGALSVLYIGAFIGIFKLVCFLVKKLFKKPPSKKIIIIVLCVILGIALIASIIAFKPATETKEIEYTITFYNNKGIYFWNISGEERISIKYQDSTVYKVETFSSGYPSEPTPPTNEEYVFLGWYQNPECTDMFLFGKDEINSDINLYAKWGEQKGK